MMKVNFLVWLSLIGLISSTVTSCSKFRDPVASFNVVIDPEVRGKINTSNTSFNDAESYWEIWHIDANGTRGMSSSNPNSTSDATNASFYVSENGTYEIVLAVINENRVESECKKIIEVSNIPTKVTIEKLVITEVSLVNESGYEWDDADGSTFDYSYDFSEEYPDLLVNNEPFKQNKTYEDHLTYWNVDIENGLPFEMTKIEKRQYHILSFQSDEYYIELVDIDGTPNWLGELGGEQIGVARINPYHLTHKYNYGKDSNFPDKYLIEEEYFKAELHMKWEL